MTAGDLRELLDDDVPDDLPIRIASPDGRVWAIDLVGAHATLAGPDRHLTLEVQTR